MRRKRLTGIGVVLVLHGVLLVGCSSSGLSCGQQRALAGELAGDPALSVSADPSTTSQAVPCDDNSGGSMVLASRYYEAGTPVSFDGLVELGGKAAGTGDWAPLAEIRPENAGGLGDGLVCFRGSAGDAHRYLILRTGDRAAQERYSSYSISVGQAEDEVDVCPVS